jgi:hypothetical protein
VRRDQRVELGLGVLGVDRDLRTRGGKQLRLPNDGLTAAGEDDALAREIEKDRQFGERRRRGGRVSCGFGASGHVQRAQSVMFKGSGFGVEIATIRGRGHVPGADQKVAEPLAAERSCA